MQSFAEALKSYTRDNPFDPGNGHHETVLDQLYQAYDESHESDPPEISEGFKELSSIFIVINGGQVQQKNRRLENSVGGLRQ